MKKVKGFTWIEMMIVIAIIAILAAVAIPAYNDYHDKRNGMIAADQNSNFENCYHGYALLPNGNQMIDRYGRVIQCIN